MVFPRSDISTWISGLKSDFVTDTLLIHHKIVIKTQWKQHMLNVCISALKTTTNFLIFRHWFSDIIISSFLYFWVLNVPHWTSKKWKQFMTFWWRNNYVFISGFSIGYILWRINDTQQIQTFPYEETWQVIWYSFLC